MPEVWRCDGARLQIFRLQSDQYGERAESIELSGVTSEVLTRFVEISKTMRRPAWLREVCAWAQAASGTR